MGKILAILVFALIIFVGDADSQSLDALTATTKIDEFGKVAECDLKARVDAIFIELAKKEGSSAHVIVYRGASGLPGARDEWVFRLVKSRFEKVMTFRKYDQSVLTITDGGFRDRTDIWIEVFIVPKGDAPPVPTQTVSKPAVTLDKTFMTDVGWLLIQEAVRETSAEIETESEMPDDTNEGEVIYEPDSEAAAEVERSDDEVNPDDVPYDPEFSEPDIIDLPHYWNELLSQNRDARGVVIFYADDATYDLERARPLIQNRLRELAVSFGLDVNRVELVYGGFRANTETEFWYVPKGGKAPEATPEKRPEPTPKP